MSNIRYVKPLTPYNAAEKYCNTSRVAASNKSTSQGGEGTQVSLVIGGASETKLLDLKSPIGVKQDP